MSGSKVEKILVISFCVILFVLMLLIIWGTMREYPHLPDEGIWKCDELNITLYLDDRREGVLSLGDEKIFLSIMTEYNASNFSLCVHPIKNDDSCSLKLESAVFNGYYDGMKDGCLYFSDWDGKTYCFVRVG